MSGMRSPAQTQKSLDREIEAINYRRMGMTYSDIAKTLGYADHVGALRAVKRGMRKALQEPADELRELEAARLDRAQEKIWPKVEEGDVRAITALLRIMERRAKLLGLDAPLKIQQDIAVFDGMSDLDREVQRLAELLASNGHAYSGGSTDYLAIESGESGTEATDD